MPLSRPVGAEQEAGGGIPPVSGSARIFRLVLSNDLDELERLGEWVDETSEALGLAKGTVFGLHLCFEEAVSNVIRHAYPGMDEDDPRRGDVVAEIRVDGPILVASVADDGVAFDPTAAADPRQAGSVEDASIGGLGIHLMRQFTQDIRYERADGMNRLVLTFEV